MSELRAPPDDRDPDALIEFGVLNLDKPPGPSAHQVSAWVRDLTGVEKAAHAGTLDPKVTGCLPELLGSATRLAPALLEGAKSYVAVLELHDDPPTELESIVGEFEGEIYQKPPKKSAVARRLRTRTVYDLDVLEIEGRQVLLNIRCESGTYVRKLCHDIGLALGTGAHMGDLRRTGTDPFDDTDLATLYDLADALAVWREDGDASWLREVVHPAERALTHLPRVTIARTAATSVAEGAPVYAPGVIDAENATEDELIACYTPNGAAICLGRLVGDPDAAKGEVVNLERVLV
ncbi:RNA-guided pseudouridylation complex pseudouridine synthase subunit Cbf5 [Halanaeroarchaeum sulfurireducens]|uniref:Probable tRNA pseudouridine synthase B n=1 Tax=Halanaeroarchaeum sulfurireducens TaxID=1604004 RepID=A0A0F7PAN0_9EURY|nr:RNA-guided pseudouridylation complex pseudouridine synthase subunit Cbf5 [Halanaeroarchaeum sulfurireducens]AKH98236.1 tRNA pseudouridine synthase B [Halanaeroarchaeum sulfurireducens]ALG82630.1 tRNA pseudouridine synthase B [Halanaeroarchaeum sulfurireducens]